MARVTVEDCVEQIPNRFELVVLAAERARAISSGSPLTIAKDNDKNPVIALREIAAGNVSADILRETHVSSFQKTNKIDEVDDENLYAEGQDNSELNEELSEVTSDNIFSADEEGFDIDVNYSDEVVEED